MNKIEEGNLKQLATNYKNVCISIDVFLNLLSSPWSDIIEPLTDGDILLIGKYGSMLGCNIWVCRTISSDSIKVSNQNISSVIEDKWSDSIPLELASADYLERILKLKAFW